MRFLENGENVVFLGPPGVGKTHLASALGLVGPDRKFCVNADKLSSRKEEQLRGFFGLDTARLNSAYPPVFRGEKRYARAA